MVSFGLWVKQRRKELDLTQEELSLRVGCSLVLIQKIEAGQRRPSKQIAELLAQHLDVPAGDRPDFVRFARARTSKPIAAAGTPWRTLRRQFTNLPAQPNPLFGREEAVEAIRRRLLHEPVRLMTLVGPPGIGKTRLGIAAAARLVEDYEQGVVFISLAAATDPNQVVTSLAKAFAIKEAGGTTLFERVKLELADKRILLLLDNFEQVITAAPLVADLLAACPWLQILATSRVPLHIRAERQFRVSPLGLAPLSPTPELQTVLAYPAEALFVDRARAAWPDFAVTPENAPAIAKICTRLDGLPLAIELVAVRAGQVQPAILLTQLVDRMGLLTAGPRDLPVRQQTLRRAIDWSYDLLEPDERVLFAHLAVFVGGCTLEMAEFVCGNGAQSVDEPLEGLVDQSLVIRREQEGSGPRFLMLETIRAYALERLEERGEAVAIQKRHSACMLDLAERAEIPQPAWLARLDNEHDNLLAVIQRAQTGCDASTALHLTAHLWRFWLLRGYLSEGIARLKAALELEEGRSDPTLALARAEALIGIGWLLRDLSDFVQAQKYFNASLAIYQQCSDRAGLAHALYSVGYIQFLIGDSAQGIWFIEESLSLYRALNDDKGLSLTLFMLGRIAVGRGDYPKAAACLEECLRLEQASAKSYGVARIMASQGELAIYQGKHERAAALLAESQTLLEKLGERQLCAWLLTKRGELALRLGCLSEARAFLKRGIDLAREMGYRWNEAYSLTYLGLVSLFEGDPQQAQALCEESLVLFRELESEGDVAQTRKDLARVALASGEVTRAADLYRECTAIFFKRDYLPDIVECLEGLAGVHIARSDPGGAACILGAAQACREQLGMPLAPVFQPAYLHDVELLRSTLKDDLLMKIGPGAEHCPSSRPCRLPYPPLVDPKA